MQDTALHTQIYDLFFNVTFHAARAFLVVVQRDSFLYWPFLLSTLGIAMIAWRFGHARGAEAQPAGWREFFRRFFGPALWWHPSACADYRFYLVNAIVFPLLVSPFLFDEKTIVGLLDAGFGQTAGSAGAGAAEYGLAAKLTYTLLFFLAYDFGRFAAHGLLHDVPFLWEFHKVHHSAEVLTPITSFRVHPFDLAVMASVPAVTTGVETWMFHRYVHKEIGYYTFLGLHALMWIFNLIGNLRHWHVWVSYGATLNRWLISPAHHQIHHSAEPRHWGCNRGFELAIWDRLFGTLYVPSNDPETFKMGLGDGTDGRWHSVTRFYLWPFWLLLKRAAPGRPQGEVK